MNPAAEKKTFRAFAKQLEDGIPPTEEQTKYLIHVFRGIGTVRDPIRILGLSYENGKSKEDEVARINMDLIFHWIACATQANVDIDGMPIKPYSKTKAFKEGSKIAKILFGAGAESKYDSAYIRKSWYQKKKEHQANILRSAFDKDSFYEYTVPKQKK